MNWRVYIVLLIIIFSSCKKEKDTIAEITVVDNANNPVPDVTVRLISPGDKSLNKEDITSSRGQVRFNYTEEFELGSGGFAVLDIMAFSDTDTIYGMIEIIEEEITEKTIQFN